MKNIYHYHYFTWKASNNEKFNNNVLKIKLSITNCGTDILKLSHAFLFKCPSIVLFFVYNYKG